MTLGNKVDVFWGRLGEDVVEVGSDPFSAARRSRFRPPRHDGSDSSSLHLNKVRRLKNVIC